MIKINTLAAALAIAGACTSASAQQRDQPGSSARRAGAANDPLIAWAAVWGDTQRTGVYTCEEWKRYATRLFNDADKNRDGYLDAREFESIRQADTMLRSADLAYFDDNRDGRLSRSEFVDKPNQFFARYDRKGECRVTLDSLMEGAADKARAGRSDR